MRANIEIDAELMRKALQASGSRNKRAVVEEALRLDRSLLEFSDETTALRAAA